MKKAAKWRFYEIRWDIRQFYFHKVLRQHIFEKYFGREPIIYLYGHKPVHGTEYANKMIHDALLKDAPFMAARFGNTEITVMECIMRERLFGKTEKNNHKLDKWFRRLCLGAGFFPDDFALAERFTDLMLESCSQIDLHAQWHRTMEDYIITEYMQHSELTYLRWLEPWYAKHPWTAALKGKKVLVIHPFENSIREQYQRRDKIFPGTDILPEFELKTLKAVQSSGGETDGRFKDWFEALDFMYQEAMKIDFEVAIIGCGAYGMPLAAMLKKAGKKAIHLGGVTQILFGIKGRRWVESRVDKIPFNDAWVFPRMDETPVNAGAIETGCYWDFTTGRK